MRLCFCIVSNKLTIECSYIKSNELRQFGDKRVYLFTCSSNQLNPFASELTRLLVGSIPVEVQPGDRRHVGVCSAMRQAARGGVLCPIY